MIIKVRNFYFLFKDIIFGSLIVIISSSFYSCYNNNFEPKYQDLSIIKKDVGYLHFIVLSDWGYSGSSNQLKVASEMSSISKLYGLNFILTCGDNFQIAGVDSVEDSLWITNYETVYNDSALAVPWHPALGNHDYMGNPDAQVNYSSTSKYWKMPARYYTFVEKVKARNLVRFIVLDTQGLIKDYDNLTDTTDYKSIAQYTWLNNVLSGINEKWVIVTGHHPVFSASNYHGDTYLMKKIIKPLFDKYKVDFYICGHDHNFEHAKDAQNYTDYIVTGTAGTPRTEGRNEKTVFSMSELGFSYVTMNEDSVKLYFVTSTGKIGYNFTKTK